MKKKALIYPYDIESAAIIRSKEFSAKYVLIAAIAPQGWGYTGKDVGDVDGQAPFGVKVDSCFEKYIDDCDTVIFIQSEHTIDFNKNVYPKIHSAIAKKKEIICLINKYDLSDLRKLALENKVNFIEYDYSPFEVITKNAYIMNIDTPIVAILGLAENMDKFQIQLMVTEQLKQMGYKTLLIGSRYYTDLVGGIPFPKFMFETKLSESEKIKNFNRFVKSQESIYKPDIIILGVPGGILPYNKIINNNFGITAFECMQAVPPDFCILSLYSNIYTEEYFSGLQNLFKYRFGSRIDIFNITNQKIDSAEMFYDPEKVRTYTVSAENMELQVKNAKEVSDMFIVNAKSVKGAETITNRIVEVLSGDESGLSF